MDVFDRAQEAQARDNRLALDLHKASVGAAPCGLPDPNHTATCADCGEEIPAARRQALPGVITCINCQTARESGRELFEE